jgi:hypothetical protein
MSHIPEYSDVPKTITNKQKALRSSNALDLNLRRGTGFPSVSVEKFGHDHFFPSIFQFVIIASSGY